MREELKKIRKKKYLTQQQVALKLNISTRAYQRIEDGVRGTSEKNWISLFDIFDQEVPLQILMQNNNVSKDTL